MKPIATPARADVIVPTKSEKFGKTPPAPASAKSTPVRSPALKRVKPAPSSARADKHSLDPLVPRSLDVEFEQAKGRPCDIPPVAWPCIFFASACIG